MSRVPAIVVGGGPQALSTGRSLAAIGVPVYSLGGDPELRWSRAFRGAFLTQGTDAAADKEQAWTRWLLGEPGGGFAGAVVLACEDAAVSLIAQHRPALAERFRLDISEPAAQLDMLDKLATYEIATKAGVPTPRYWTVGGADEVERRRLEFCYPLLVKPLHSHRYRARFPGRFAVVHSPDDLLARYRPIAEAGLDCMLVELIEGPDSLLCSYFTYIDESGEPAFHFTKRVVRRCPPLQGNACHHVTDVIPEVREVGLRLVRASGLRGLANVEFKLDTRDGVLKLIECNARLVGPNALVTRAGIDIAALVYRRVLGEPVSWPTRYRSGLRMVHLSDDLRSFLALRRAGELTTGAWLRSVARPHMTMIMRWDDPAPAVARGYRRLRALAGKALRGVARRSGR